MKKSLKINNINKNNYEKSFIDCENNNNNKQTNNK